MKINNELKGKDVINDSGDKISEINDVEWNPQTNHVESLIVKQGGIIGGGKERIINYTQVKTIGEKVLLNHKTEIKEEEEPISIEEIKRREEEL